MYHLNSDEAKIIDAVREYVKTNQNTRTASLRHDIEVLFYTAEDLVNRYPEDPDVVQLYTTLSSLLY